MFDALSIFKSQSHGLFTVQSTCCHPKLLGLLVMVDPLPRITFYNNNACNLAQTVALRSPWIFDQTTFVCDGLHYASHKCSSLFDPDSFYLCGNMPTSGAEAINRKWKVGRTHITILSKKNLMLFLYARLFFLNIRNFIRERFPTTDVEDTKDYECINEIVIFDFRRCENPFIL